MIYTLGLDYLEFEEYSTKEIIESLSYIKEISLDIETTGLNPWSDELLLLALGCSDFQIIINCRNCDEEVTQIINSIKDKKIIIQNSKFDLKFIKHKYNISFNDVYCTMLASQILYNGYEVKNDLKSICKRFLDKEISKETRVSFYNKPLNSLFTKNEIEYAAKDISLLNCLYRAQEPYIEKYNMAYLIELENKITPIIIDMELKGIDLDTDKWKKVLKENLKRKQELILLMDSCLIELSLIKARIIQKSVQTNIFKESDILTSDSGINYNSHSEVKKIFSRALEEIDSTSEESLKVFRRNKSSKMLKFVDLLLEYREIGTEINVFGDKFLKYINPYTKKIHTSFTQCTRSGRFTSGDERDDKGKKSFSYVNFQNIPQKEKFRSCFIALDGYSYLTADLSAQEVTIAASDSQDPLLLKSINENIDMHSLLAKESFKIIYDKEEEISKTKNRAFRDLHKNLVFAIFYGGSYKMAIDILDIPESTAKRVHNKITSLLPKFTQRMKYLGNLAKDNGFIVSNNITNRRRWFSKEYIESSSYKVEKEASNFPIQATAADQIKESLIKIYEYLKNKDAWICNTVHDEINIIFGNNMEELPNVIRKIMEDCANKYLTGVKMKVDIKISKHWEK